MARDTTLLLDRYVLQEPLGEGGSGVVNLAWDTRIQRNVAIKRIPLPRHSAQAYVPGLKEARTGAQLSDSRIVNVIDFEVTEDEALLIMEYVDGISLGSLMDRIPRMLNLDEVASIVQNVGKALQCAHRNHVLHLDVKPDNILVDLSGLCKVTDFGVGRLAGAAGFGNATGGTIGYMPPEQLDGGAVDERTDQWAFAAMVYELIVGENPFIAESFEESRALIASAEISLPSSLFEDIDPKVDDILFKAMSIDPARRYPSVGKFTTELLAHLGTPKEGRARLGKLVGIFADEIALGSPEDRLKALKRIEAGETSPSLSPPPLSEDDESFYELGEGGQLAADYDFEGDGTSVYPSRGSSSDGAGQGQGDGSGRARSSYDERRMVPRHRRPALRDALSPRAAAVFARVLGGACCAALGFLGVCAAVPPLLSQAASIGLSVEGVFWTTGLPIALIAALAALGAATPRIGSLVALEVVAVGILASGWVAQGAALAFCSLIWWLFLGRGGHAESNCALIAPAFSLLGLGYIQPLAVGWLFRGSKALFSAGFGVMLMLIIAPVTGSDSLFYAGTAFMDHSLSNELFSSNIYGSPALWASVAGWVSAALAMSLLANCGSKRLSLLGVVLGGVIIVISRALGELARGMYYDMFPVEVAAAIAVPVALMCIVVYLHSPAEEE